MKKFSSAVLFIGVVFSGCYTSGADLKKQVQLNLKVEVAIYIIMMSFFHETIELGDEN